MHTHTRIAIVGHYLSVITNIKLVIYYCKWIKFFLCRKNGLKNKTKQNPTDDACKKSILYLRTHIGLR